MPQLCQYVLECHVAYLSGKRRTFRIQTLTEEALFKQKEKKNSSKLRNTLGLKLES